MRAINIFLIFFIYSPALGAMNASSAVLAHTVKNALTDVILVQNILSTKKKIDSQMFEINAVAFRQDGAIFASAYNNLIDPILKIWNPERNEPLVKYNNDEDTLIKCVAFDCKGELLVCGMSNHLHFFDTKSWKLIRDIIPGVGDVSTLAFSNSGKNIIIGGNAKENNLAIFKLHSRTNFLSIFPGHTDKTISWVGFSPDGTRAVSLGENECKVWDVVNKVILNAFWGMGWSDCKIEYDNNNKWFVTGYDKSDGIVGYWFSYDLDSRTKTKIPLLGKILPVVKAYERSACGNYIFLGDAAAENITIFNLCTRKYVQTIALDGLRVSTITCSPDGKCMVMSSKGLLESSLWLCNLIQDEDQKTLHTVYAIGDEQLKFIQKLLSKADSKATLGKKKSDHILFNDLPQALRILIYKFVIPQEVVDNDFILMDEKRKEIDQSKEDEWTIID